MNEKWTPGPWGACGADRNGERCPCGVVWSETADCPVCHVEGGKWGDPYPAIRIKEGSLGGIGEVTLEAYSELAEYGEIPRGAQYANMDLIAAAPEMYEALASIENDDGKIPAAIWAMRNAALAKARGG